MIHFQERSFVSDKSFRPRPLIHINADLGLVFIATVWGKAFPIEDLISRLEGYLISSQTDTELTSPFQTISSYSKSQNNIRIATLMINDYLVKQKNKNEYNTGLEIFLGIHKDQQFCFTTFGQPHLLISKQDRSILPIRLNIDHSLDMSGKDLMPALPSHLLGLNSRVDPEVQSLTVGKNDQILLLSKSWIPEKMVSLETSKRDFEEYLKILSEYDDQPYWFGMVTFEK